MISEAFCSGRKWLYDQVRGGPPLRMGWRNLLFENYPVAPDRVRPRLPDGLELDTFENHAWLTVVPFRNVAIRPSILPAPLGYDLPELNLRTYVRCNDKKGIYFFSLDARGVIGVTGARFFHHLPYYYARIDVERNGTDVSFKSRRLHPGAEPALYDVTYGPDSPPFSSKDRELTEFLLERYRFFAESPNGTLHRTSVDHPPWTIRDAFMNQRRNSIFQGSGFGIPESEPVLFFSEGVKVRATACRPVTTGP